VLNATAPGPLGVVGFGKGPGAVVAHRPGVVAPDMNPNDSHRHKTPDATAELDTELDTPDSVEEQPQSGFATRVARTGHSGQTPQRPMTATAHATSMATQPTRRPDAPIGTSPSNATSFAIYPRELGLAMADAPERVAVDLRLPVELHVRTPTRQFRFEFVDDPHETAEVAYVEVVRSRSLDESDQPQCVPEWMPAIIAYVGFEIADSGVLR